MAAMLAAAPMMAQTAKKSFTLDDLLGGGATYWNLQPEYVFTEWWGDTPVRLTVDEARTLDTDPGTLLFTTDDINAAIGEKLLRACTAATFPYPGQTIVKVQTPRRIVLVDFSQKSVVWQADIAEGATEITWNAASRRMAYCIGSDVYVQMADGSRRRLTTDGSDDIVYGHSVSRDEFGISSGLFWSHDGSRLAFYRKDQSRIPSYPQVDITKRIAQTYVDKYPMAGCESEDVSVAVYDVDAATTTWLQNPKPKTDYMTNITWAPDASRLYVFELNREQNHMQLFAYDAATGAKAKEPILEERHPQYVEPLNTLSFLPWDDTKAVMQSRRDNWNHLYLIDMAKAMYPEWRNAAGGGTTRDFRSVALLTPGDFEVIDFVGFNRKARTVVFRANATHPLHHTVWAAPAAGKGAMQLVSAGEGVHTASLSDTGTQLIDTYSSPTVARQVTLLPTAKGKTLRASAADLMAYDPLADKRSAARSILTAADPWTQYAAPEITSGSIKAADGTTDLYYRLIKPVGFDPAAKYPAVVYVYGGPHAHNVQASRGYGFRGWEIYMAQRGYVVFVLDNRGSQYRGLAFEQATFRHLGDEEMRDQMCGVQFLKTLPYVDAERLGVHGWSFGGFMTTNLMCSYPDVFKVGVAGGPVVDWKYYEVMYGERYMDTPDENPDGYASSSLLPKAKNLKGRLQIILGYNDPTCVPQHTLSFLRAAIDAGTQPDLFLYPGDGHNMFGTDQVHLHHRITRYFDDYLK